MPDIATQRCRGRDSWQTRGQFIPVLSYQEQLPSIINACSRQETNLSHAPFSFVTKWIGLYLHPSRTPIALRMADVQSLRAKRIYMRLVPSVLPDASACGVLPIQSASRRKISFPGRRDVLVLSLFHRRKILNNSYLKFCLVGFKLIQFTIHVLYFMN